MRTRLSGLAIPLLLIPLASGSSQDARTTSSTVIRGYPTPKAVFDACAEARRKHDYRTHFECLTPEAQRVCLFETLFASGLADLNKSAAVKAITDKHIQANWQKAFDQRYREKFGIDRTKTRAQQAQNPSIQLPEDTELMAEVLAEHIPDQVGFFSEMNQLLDKGQASPPKAQGHLQNVVISGDTATGQTESQLESIESDGRGPYKIRIHKYLVTIHFRRTKAGWLLDTN